MTEGHLHSHTKILVKRLPENVPEIPIYFLLHEYWLNHGLIQFLPNRMERFDSIWCDLDQHKSNRNSFDSYIYLSQRDSNL